MYKDDTILIAGDSILHGIMEQKMSKKPVKVRCFPGATINNMKDYLKPLIKKCPSALILHVGTNDAVNSTSHDIAKNLMSLRTEIINSLPNCKVFISTPIIRTDYANYYKVESRMETSRCGYY